MTSSLPCTSVPRPWRRPVTDTGTQDKEHNAIMTWCVQCKKLKPYALSIKKITEIYGQEISPLPGEQVLYGQDGQDLLLRLGPLPQEGGEAAAEARYKKISIHISCHCFRAHYNTVRITIRYFFYQRNGSKWWCIQACVCSNMFQGHQTPATPTLALVSTPHLHQK